MALKYYKRLDYFNSSPDPVNTKIQIAKCHENLDQFEQAFKFYQSAYSTSKNDSLKFELVLHKARVFLLQGQYNHSLLELYKLPDIGMYGNQQEYKTILIGVCEFRLERYEEALFSFISILPEGDSINASKIRALTNSKKLNKPNENLAATLSMIIPGSGQCYAGNCVDGLNSLGLLSFTIGIMAHITIQYSIYESLIAVSPWFQRYYKGGFENARNEALKKRSANRSQILSEIFAVLNQTTQL